MEIFRPPLTNRRSLRLIAAALLGLSVAAAWASIGRTTPSSSPPLALPPSLDLWMVQAKEPGRVSVVPSPGRRDQKALRLQVLPGDTNVAGSGPGADRADAMIGSSLTDAVEGREQWWAWSTYFPNDYHPTPATAWNGFLDFHNTGDTGLANIGFQVNAHYAAPRLEMTVYGDTPSRPPSTFTLGRVRRVQWYDFILHVVWSSNPRVGFVELYLDGRRIAGPQRRPTLYAGQSAYLKLANYREAGQEPSAILVAGVRRTKSYASAVRGFRPFAAWARRLTLNPARR